MKISFVLILLISVAIAQPYKHLSFAELSSTLYNLTKNFPDLIKLETAHDLYNLSNPDCSPFQCPIFIVTLTHFPTLDQNRPEVFISGALHGNEVLGPNVAVYLIEYMAEKYNKSDWITYLLTHRKIVIMPVANSQGYYYNRREENVNGYLFDPNRDFPYDNSPSNCMNTLSGQAVYQVISSHLFILGITFHGGDSVVSYPWGSTNHLSFGKGQETPDNLAMHQLGEVLVEQASDLSAHNIGKYNLGKMTDTVYAVKGGLEDWAYAAGWTQELEGGTNNIICTPKILKEYNLTFIQNTKNVKFPLYLVETDLEKNPKESTRGTRQGVYNAKGTIDDGHIPRNIRLSLALIDMAQPYIRDIEQKPYDETHIEIRWKIGGSVYVNHTFVEYQNMIDNKIANTRDLKTGPGYWKDKDYYYKSIIPINNYTHPLTRFRIGALVDQQWEYQTNPQPSSPPLTHFVKTRLHDIYEVSNFSSDSPKILTSRIWYSDFNNSMPINATEIANMKSKNSEMRTYIIIISGVFLGVFLLASIVRAYILCRRRCRGNLAIPQTDSTV